MVDVVTRYWPVSVEPSRHPQALISLAEPASRYVLRTRDIGSMSTPMLAATAYAGGYALHIGPDEWLLILPEGKEPPQLDGRHSIVNVSDRSVGLLIEGDGAVSLVQTGCPLDLHGFKVGKATRTLFEGVEIVLWRTNDDAFHIEVWRSFASWLHAALDLAAGDLP